MLWLTFLANLYLAKSEVLASQNLKWKETETMTQCGNKASGLSIFNPARKSISSLSFPSSILAQNRFVQIAAS